MTDSRHPIWEPDDPGVFSTEPEIPRGGSEPVFARRLPPRRIPAESEIPVGEVEWSNSGSPGPRLGKAWRVVLAVVLVAVLSFDTYAAVDWEITKYRVTHALTQAANDLQRQFDQLPSP